MVNTSQVNQTGADAKATIIGMKKASRKENCESHLWQHNNLPLVFAAWNDNAVVKSLSNFHSPIIIQNSVQ